MPRPGERINIKDRITARVVVNEAGCWLWQGAKWLSSGYGRIELREGVGRSTRRMALVHRVSYAAFRGPIPDSLVIDHLCRVKHCVNPAHLDAVTGQTNTLRGEGPSALNARKTHCPQGHPYGGDNVRYKGGRRPQRVCRTCKRRAEVGRVRPSAKAQPGGGE